MDGATPDPGTAPGVAAAARAAPRAPGTSVPESPPGLLASVRGLLAELPGLVSDRVHLFSLELKRAGRALAQMLALVVAASVLAVTAWLALWAAIAAGLIEAGMPWGWAAFLVLVLNLGAAAGAVWLALKQARLLALPAMVRRLTVSHRHPPAATGLAPGAPGATPGARGGPASAVPPGVPQPGAAP
jgi:uncharacterized membrane protein YqjE